MKTITEQMKNFEKHQNTFIHKLKHNSTVTTKLINHNKKRFPQQLNNKDKPTAKIQPHTLVLLQVQVAAIISSG
jgi:hypothetical protein